MASDRLGVLCALPQEARAFSSTRLSVGDIVTIKDNLILGVSGAGWEAAETMAIALVEKKISTLICWGFAGSLSTDADNCQLLLPRSLVTERNSFPVSDQLWRQWESVLSRKMNLCDGTMFTAPAILRTVEEKKKLHDRYHACSVDMESAAVASVAIQQGIDVVVIKTVTDGSLDTIPQYIDEATDWTGSLKGLLLSPTTLGSLCKLGLGYRRALKSLGLAKLLLSSEAGLLLS